MNLKIDFVIVGSGLSGLVSAITLSEYGEVLIISKKKLSDTATNLAQGGIAAVMQVDDSFGSHIEDTLRAGSYHNNRESVEYLVKHAKEAILFLENHGVVFDKKNGSYSLGREGAHLYKRIIHSGDITGNSIQKALLSFIKTKSNIHVLENTCAVDLIVKDKRCFGVEVIYEGHEKSIFSRLAVLATGGFGQLYRWTTNPEIATGDGIAMAYRAGCRIVDLEFIQFHPTALKVGNSPLFLLSEALRGEGAYLKKWKMENGKWKMEGAERFMKEYDQREELASRDIVSRAIFNEQNKGFEVFLDTRHKGREFIQKRFPNIFKEVKKRGYDMAKDLVPVAPAVHYSCGGVMVDLYGRTDIENLFAFGEVACTGVHGANRLASNSLLEAVVFPMMLSKCIGRVPKDIVKIENERKDFDGYNARDTDLSEIQNMMWEKVGIVRTKKGLEEAQNTLNSYSEKSNIILVAKLIVNASYKRKQSLGAHYRVD